MRRPIAVLLIVSKIERLRDESLLIRGKPDMKRLGLICERFAGLSDEFRERCLHIYSSGGLCCMNWFAAMGFVYFRYDKIHLRFYFGSFYRAGCAVILPIEMRIKVGLCWNCHCVEAMGLILVTKWQIKTRCEPVALGRRLANVPSCSLFRESFTKLAQYVFYTICFVLCMNRMRIYP